MTGRRNSSSRFRARKFGRNWRTTDGKQRPVKRNRPPAVPAADRPPTAKQISYLRVLAKRAGVEPPTPTSLPEASRMIDDLRR